MNLLSKHRKWLLPFLLLFFTVSTTILICHNQSFKKHNYSSGNYHLFSENHNQSSKDHNYSSKNLNHSSENEKFEQFIQQLFQAEVCSSTINLHYTLADPDSCEITDYPITFGSIPQTDENTRLASLENHVAILSSFQAERLSEENQLTLAILKQHAQAQLDCPDAWYLQEPLSPSLGIQAQLPVLLAEYTFRTKQDVLDYLKLLKTLPTYFENLLSFEQEKSERGLFMNKKAVQGIIEQCTAFIESPDDNYLIPIFNQKVAKLPSLTEEERTASQTLHQKLIKAVVIPAYQQLIDGLRALSGTGRNNQGLVYYPGGENYYTYLLRTQVGTEDSPDTVEQRLYQQLSADSLEMQQLLSENPSLLDTSDNSNNKTSKNQPDKTQESISSEANTTQKTESDGADTTHESESKETNTTQSTESDETNTTPEPEETLKILQTRMSEDFPDLPDVAYEVKYVHEDLQEFLSPAFYLTPPVDTNSPNAIYINPHANMSGTELFTTLAHEGFPGHLYQTIYFAKTNPPLIRHLYATGGYIEGWATYIESYAYTYADGETAENRLKWLNRSINLCLYSLMDVGIHYHGWSEGETAVFLAKFGITDLNTVADIYQYILETPANYLKYYYGYLNFLDLRTACQEAEGSAFTTKEFHRRLLELGPMPFSILKSQLLS